MANSVRQDIDRMVQALVDADTDAKVQAALDEIFEMWDRDGYTEEITPDEEAAMEVGFAMYSKGKPSQSIREKMLEKMNVKVKAAKPPEPAGPPPFHGMTATKPAGPPRAFERLHAALSASRGQGRKKKASKKTKKQHKNKRRVTRRV